MQRLFLLLFLWVLASCSRPVFKEKWTKETAPAVFWARFETTKGNFDIEIKRELSPAGADRLYQLIKHSFFDSVVFYRVVPKFVAQFGTGDTALEKSWSKFKLPDEEVKASNVRGTISYARSGKETRGTVLFINLVDNPRLDTINYNGVKGFPVLGKVVEGMQTVDSLYNGYGGTTMNQLDTMYRNKEAFFKKFPKLDVVKKAYLVRRKNK
ncbi:peptidylprolyl isomerase [Lacibacter sp. MH-610]|uniref:peptidylprolyl isomerase n=1 Tax=Lacibacter sp. MH-610 TaxID=3020883 RepID=UPI0038926776